jgi:hypothetical protein
MVHGQQLFGDIIHKIGVDIIHKIGKISSTKSAEYHPQNRLDIIHKIGKICIIHKID